MIIIIEKLGITPGYHRAPGDNIIRHGTSFSNVKHHYSLEEMHIIDAAPKMLEALIESTIFVEKIMYEVKPNLWSDVQQKGYSSYESNKRAIEKACYPMEWQEIKELR